jgi:hypothetical protein
MHYAYTRVCARARRPWRRLEGWGWGEAGVTCRGFRTSGDRATRMNNHTLARSARHSLLRSLNDSHRSIFTVHARPGLIPRRIRGSRFDIRRTVGFSRRVGYDCARQRRLMQLPSAHKKPFTEKRRAICRSAYAVDLARNWRSNLRCGHHACDAASRRQCCKTCGNDAPAVRDETRGPVQTETAESLPRDRRGRFHRPHPTGTVPADVHAKFCTSVEKAVQTSIVTREAQKGCCLRGSRPFSRASHRK